MKRSTPKTRAAIDQLEDVFKALADKTRLRILALLGNNEVCVCHIHDSLGVPQPTASRHLAYLRRTGLVAARRDGVWMHYQVSKSLDPVVQHVVNAAVDALGQAARHRERPQAVSALVRTALRAGQSGGRRVLRAKDVGAVNAMIEAATDRDLPQVRSLLEQHQLPLDGIDDHLGTMLVVRDGSRVVGTAALELYPGGALLRSVAVDAGQQGRHLGHQLTEAALRLAQDARRRGGVPADDDRGAVLSEVRLRADRARGSPRLRARLGRIHIRVSRVGDRDEKAPGRVMDPERARRLVAEAIGTAMLLAAVVGSGIMAERLGGGNQALALLANTVATGAALVALILTFGPVSGAHFNPAVTIATRRKAVCLERGAGLCLRAVRWGGCRRLGRARDVRRASVHAVTSWAQRSCAAVQRVPGHVRIARRHLGMLASSVGYRPVRRRRPTSRPRTGSRPPHRLPIPR